MARILIVDDNRDIVHTLGMYLQSRGHVVDALFEGANVVEAIRTFSAEIAIIDIIMPGVSGDHVYYAIRDVIGADFPVVICSGTSMRLRAPDDMNLVYSPKPIDFDRIDELVDLMTRSTVKPDATRR